jgi:crotonobetainyl-CoA:carnitine CoA-transferase CaiB-like acyl-CoA transferase
VAQEAARGAERQAAIVAGWAMLQQHQAAAGNAATGGDTAPLTELQEAFARELVAQRAACDAAVAGRQAVVAASVAELRTRDEEYVRAMEQHGRDVDALLAKMRTDSAAMQARYEVRTAEGRRDWTVVYGSPFGVSFLHLLCIAHTQTH